MAFGDKSHNNNYSGKIILPPSVLHALSTRNIEYPMLFKISSISMTNDLSTHCGVLEFSAEEGKCYLPYWIIQHLCIEEFAPVIIESVSLPLGKFVKVQPVTSDFLKISDQRAVLETSLRNFATFTVGDEIPIHYNDKEYRIKILEVKPGDAISITEADVEVDFAPPADYVPTKTEKIPQSQPITIGGGDGNKSETGSGFNPFSGRGNSLKDGNSFSPSITPPFNTPTTSSSLNTPPLREISGASKLVFGGSARLNEQKTTTTATTTSTSVPKDASSFQAFSGKGYSLK
jgi:ubiquitin fusion degradation protein 1